MIKNYDFFEDSLNNVFQIRTKSDTYVVEFNEPVKVNIFKEIVQLIQQDKFATFRPFFKHLCKNYEKTKVIDVLKELHDFGFMPYEFIVDFQQETGVNHEQSNDYSNPINPFNSQKIGVIGEGDMLRLLCTKAELQGYKDIQTLDTYKAYNEHALKDIIQKCDFLIVEGHHWNPHLLKQINILAIEANKPWLYVSGIEGTSVKVGPIFWAEETGCYECLSKRLKSNHETPDMHIAYENFLLENKKSAKPDNLPCNMLVQDMAASYAILETNKFLDEWATPEVWKCYLSIDIISHDISKHHLLKVPHCEVCKPALDYNPAPWLESVTLK